MKEERMEDKLLLTADIYWASQPDEVAKLRHIGQGLVVVRNEQGFDSVTTEREALAMQLAKSGFLIDVPIMVWGWDPYTVMLMRKEYGYTWVPSALQPQILIAPGLGMPGVPPYDPKNPPPGSIKVSVFAEDYPPFHKPLPPSDHEPERELIGGPVFPNQKGVGSIWFSAWGDTAPAGTRLQKEGVGVFVKREVPSIGGFQRFWERVE